MSSEQSSGLIAIVDDDISVQSALQDLIESDGLSTVCFGSAEEFLASGAEHKAGCLIADIRMPGMSGIELQAKLKADRCRIPIVFITAHGDAKMRIQAMRDGAVEFLTKPFERSLKHVVAERKPVEFLDARALCTLRAKPLINIVQLEESWSSACHPRHEI